MPHQVHGVLLRVMSGTELSRVRTELRLLLPEPISQRLLASRGADIVMQSSGFELARCITWSKQADSVNALTLPANYIDFRGNQERFQRPTRPHVGL